MAYDQGFFDYVNSGSTHSARTVLPLLHAAWPVASVLDVGCGAGAWLAEWRRLGVTDVVGLDGAYVDTGRLLIPASDFLDADLSRPFRLGRRFDLVQCLEVAEHLPAASADDLVASLVAHGDRILFSAAVPGQGGDHHVNEQPLDYWRRRFGAQGFKAFDFIRPLVAGRSEVETWYRYNTILYVHQAQVPHLPEAVRATLVGEGRALGDPSPLHYRLRKALIRQLPTGVVTAIAKLKERLVVQMRSAGGSRP